MKAWKKTAIAFAVIVILLAGGLFLSFLLFTRSTSGDKIPAYDRPAKALFVIDIQEDYTGKTAPPDSPYRNRDEFIRTVNRAIARAEETGMIVVYIRQEFDGFPGEHLSKLLMGGTALKGTPGAQVDSRIRRVPGGSPRSAEFSKPRGDAFSNHLIEEFLARNRVNEIYLTGLDAEYCVHLTAQGALNRGYRVNVLTDAILLAAEKKWKDLLKEYEKEGITLLESGSL